MKRTIIGAALTLALAVHAEAAQSTHRAAPRHAAPVGLAIGKTALPGHAAASSGHRFGAALPTAGCNPNFVSGQVPPAATWNAAIGCAFPKAGGTLQGPLGLPASTTATAPLNFAVGVAPNVASDGDMYRTPSGFFLQAGGTAIGPLGSGGGGGGSNTSFLASGNYVNIPSVTTSANQSLSAFVGPNVLLKNYGSTQIAYHAAASATTVTVATADGIIEPGGSQEIALGTNAAIAVASVVNGSISGTGSIQIIDGSGLWTGSGGGSSGGGAVTISGPLGTQAISAAVSVTPATSSVWAISASSLPLPTGASTAANQNATAAGTSATSAQAVQGVNGAVPLRVRCPDDTTNCFGGTVGSNVTVVGVPTDTTAVGSPALTAPDAASSCTGGICTGTPTTGSAETFSFSTVQGAIVSARGTFTPTTTVIVEGTQDSSSPHWYPISPVNGGPSTFNAPFENVGFVASGLQGLRCRIPNGDYTTSDSITCTIRTTLTTPGLGIPNPMPVDASGHTITVAMPAVGSIGSAFPGSAAGVGANANGLMAPLIQAGASVVSNPATSGTTQLVALSAGKSIYVTSYEDTAASGTWKLVYGTGTNCAGGTTDASPTYPMAGNQIGAGIGLGAVIVVPASNALCQVLSVSVQNTVRVSYSQF